MAARLHLGARRSGHWDKKEVVVSTGKRCLDLEHLPNMGTEVIWLEFTLLCQQRGQ
jgi:hypothetical protein